MVVLSCSCLFCDLPLISRNINCTHYYYRCDKLIIQFVHEEHVAMLKSRSSYNCEHKFKRSRRNLRCYNCFTLVERSICRRIFPHLISYMICVNCTTDKYCISPCSSLSTFHGARRKKEDSKQSHPFLILCVSLI